MKLDFFKCVDLVAVAFVATAWSQVCVAQPAGKLSGTPQEKAVQAAKAAKQRNDKAACEDEATRIQRTQRVKHPGDAKGWDATYNACMKRREAK